MLKRIVVSDKGAFGITSVWWLIIVAWHCRMSWHILKVKVLTTTIYLQFWIFKRFYWFILAPNNFLLLACEWRVTWGQRLVSQGFNSSVRMSFLQSPRKVKRVFSSAQTSVISSITVWTAAFFHREILISFLKWILSHFSLDTNCTIRIHFTSAIAASYNFECVIVIGLSG